MAYSNDMDCDGVLSADDCDDNDPSTIFDMDCDGCNDADEVYVGDLMITNTHDLQSLSS